MIDAPGIYPIKAELYHKDPVVTPSLSSSVGWELAFRTARQAYMAHPRINPNFEPEARDIFDLGKAAHALLLGDDVQFTVINVENKAGDTVTDYKTKAAKEARDGARASGRIPVLAPQWEEVQLMVKAARAQLVHHEDGQAFERGKPEMMLVWFEGEGEDRIACRCLLDWLHDEPGNIFYYYKSGKA